MNIGLVNEYFEPFAPGGAERSMRHLAERLAEWESVVVVTPNYGAAPMERDGGFRIHRFPFPAKLGYGRRLLPYSMLSNPLFYLYSALQIRRAVRAYGLHILHAQNKHTVVGTVLAGSLTGVPVVVSVRDYMILCRYGMCLDDFDTRPQDRCSPSAYRGCVRDHVALYLPDIGPARRALVFAAAVYHRLDTQLKQLALRRADAVVTISNKMREIYISRGLDPERAVTIYNPVSPGAVRGERRDSGRSSMQVLFAGDLSWKKGPHLLIEALPAILEMERSRSLQVTFAGAGPLRAPLEDRARELGLEASVRFVGRVAHEELDNLYADSDVVVVPSAWQEPFGRVALEALMHGTPVVASRRGGLPEIVSDGVTGFVVEPEAAAIAEAVARVLRSPEMRLRVRDAMPELTRRFGDDVTAAHLEMYSRLVGGDSSGIEGDSASKDG
jgi:glycosyltransferase involved in cell wall biosynthesis